MQLRQYQEPGVIDHQVQVFPPGCFVPADITVARSGLPGRRPKTQESKNLPFRFDKIPQLGSGQGFVAQIMVAIDELVPQSVTTEIR